YLMLAGLVLLLACSQFETGYFQSKVNQVTQEVVASRYGAPHKVDELPGGGTVWTYFDRGSSTAGFGTYAPSSQCKTYLLTFDRSEVLRDWKQQDCTRQSGTITEPSSSHN
ncbi:MAG: hypothetical protein OEY77_02375, partial [Nitrospira sp.]|nr:hypothetical protein [Nitrospira sp.]